MKIQIISVIANILFFQLITASPTDCFGSDMCDKNFNDIMKGNSILSNTKVPTSHSDVLNKLNSQISNVQQQSNNKDHNLDLKQLNLNNVASSSPSVAPTAPTTEIPATTPVTPAAQVTPSIPVAPATPATPAIVTPPTQNQNQPLLGAEVQVDLKDFFSNPDHILSYSKAVRAASLEVPEYDFEDIEKVFRKVVNGILYRFVFTFQSDDHTGNQVAQVTVVVYEPSDLNKEIEVQNIDVEDIDGDDKDRL